MTEPNPALDRPISVLMGKVGLDGHDRGVKIVARTLRDGGMEVIYSGLHRTPEELVITAMQEDVDVIGVSLLSGAHMTLIPRVLDLMGDYRILDRTILIVGGVIPDEDAAELRRLGVAEILGQGSSPEHIVSSFRSLVEAHRRSNGEA